MKAINYEYTGQNVIFLNKYGLYGHYIFDTLVKKNKSPLVEINKDTLPDDINKQYFIYCDDINFLIENQKILSKYNINYFVDSYFSDIIDYLSQYYIIKEIKITKKSILDFLKINNFSLDELKKLAENKYHFKLLFVFLKLYDKLNLNPSRLINLNKNVNMVFNFEDFRNLDKRDYPKSSEVFVKAIKEEDFESFINTLFVELK